MDFKRATSGLLGALARIQLGLGSGRSLGTTLTGMRDTFDSPFKGLVGRGKTSSGVSLIGIA